MNFQSLLLTCLGLLATLTASAQSFELKGSLHNDAGEVVPLAVVALHQASDSAMVKTGVADGNGNFRLVGLGANTYFVSATSVGHERLYTEPFQLADNLTLPLLRMTKSAQNLDEVTITAAKPMVEQQADRTVFNVDQTVTSGGSNGFDLLRKAPGVIIDNNESVMLDGKSGVQLYVDGKPMRLAGSDLTDYLKGLSAEEIESIELITQPSARYEAAGTAGIINIVLKKDLRFGLKGTVETGYSYWDYGKWNNRLSLSQRNKKFNFFGSYNGRLFKQRSFLNLNRDQSATTFDQTSETVADGNNNQVRAGFDYFASAKSTVGVVLDGSYNDQFNITDSRTVIAPMSTGIPSTVLVSGNEEERLNKNLFTNVNYRFKDTLGHIFTADLDYGVYESDRFLYQPNAYFNGNEQELLFERNFRMITPVEVTIASAKADYDFNFKGLKMATGAKSTLVSTTNNFEFYNAETGGDVFNPERSNDFTYDELVTGAYLQVSGKKGKVGFQAGLRAEQTHSEGDLTTFNGQGDSLVVRDYLNWFPSGGVTYQHNRINSFGLWYSRRITRPDYQSLNPFESNLDELSFQKGNPFLQPQYANNIKLTHTYKYILNTSFSFTYVEDYFAQVTDTIGATRNFITTKNVADQQVYSLDVSLPLTITDWWSIYSSVTLYYTSFTANDPSFAPISRESLSFYGQNTFSLPRDWKFEVSGWYSSPAIWGGTYRTGSQGAVDLGLRKSLLNDRVSLQFAFTDIFFTSPWFGEGEFGGVSIEGTGGWESRQVRVNLRYNFGNAAMKNVRLRKTGVEDESKRI